MKRQKNQSKFTYGKPKFHDSPDKLEPVIEAIQSLIKDAQGTGSSSDDDPHFNDAKDEEMSDKTIPQTPQQSMKEDKAKKQIKSLRSSNSRSKKEKLQLQTQIKMKDRLILEYMNKVTKLENIKYTKNKLIKLIKSSIPKTQITELILQLVVLYEDDVLPDILEKHLATVEKLQGELNMKGKDKKDFSKDLKEAILLEIIHLSHNKQRIMNRHLSKFISVPRRLYCKNAWFSIHRSVIVVLNKYEGH
eukprot:223510_1